MKFSHVQIHIRRYICVCVCVCVCERERERGERERERERGYHNAWIIFKIVDILFSISIIFTFQDDFTLFCDLPYTHLESAGIYANM